MARKKKHPEHVNHERWLVSYADFITLLFAFFTVLYATSQSDAEKVIAFENAVRMEMSESALEELVTQFAYTRPDDPRRYVDLLQKGRRNKRKSKAKFTPDESSKKMQGSGPKEAKKAAEDADAEKGNAMLNQLNDDLAELTKNPKAKSKMEIQMDERKLVIRLGEAGFFRSGSPEFRPGATDVLDSIAALLDKYPDVEITIEGHTDNRPIRTTRYRSNWELSTSRSTVVVAYFIEQHAINPHRLIAAGYAEYRPIASNDNEAGRAKNRRVDIILRNPSDDVKAFWNTHVKGAMERFEQTQGTGGDDLPEPEIP